MFDLPHKDGRQATETFMPPSLVLVEQQDAVRTLVLNRPDALNSFNAQLHEQLLSALEQAAGDATLRCVVLTGAGRGFCAGHDLSDPEASPDQNLGARMERRYQPLCLRLKSMPVPVVAAVNGVAAGAGANIALACDLVLAARSASFIQAFAKIGLVPDCGGTWLLPRLVGPARARALALTAEPLPADKAEAWGLIWKALDDAELMAQAHALCARFAAAPAVALALIKRVLDDSWSNDLDTQLELERDSQHEASLSPDYAEGVHAFLQKRPPVFIDRRAT